ncbi:hypothetical protein Taro_001848 [Colocasia esculenta]|uniref:Uncharacterized protein n=1 Tax=Colocasia esculenta TaxID=4460 RepID=A0A843TFQ5_COLES|nr:hypothetical protein [Colocasia esculenta]
MQHRIPCRWQHRWPPTTGWRQSPWTLTQVGVHLPGRLHEVGGLIPGRQQGLPGLRNYPEIPAHLHHSLGHATHVAIPNGHMGHLGTPLTQNILNVTVELSSFGRPKKEKLEPHLRPLREATTTTWSKYFLGHSSLSLKSNATNGSSIRCLCRELWPVSWDLRGLSYSRGLVHGRDKNAAPRSDATAPCT